MSAATLHADLVVTRERERGSLRHLQAFEAWFAKAVKEGHPPDRLRLYSSNEAERFWARTVPGPDGHVFWAGGASFTRNGGLTTLPRRWAWIHRHGAIPPTDSVYVTCGEKHCVNVAHLRCERRISLNQTMPDERMIGALQVVAGRLGHTPSATEWDRRGEQPRAVTYGRRFGSWLKAVKAAGLPAPMHSSRFQPASPEQCVKSLRRLARRLGHPPSGEEYGRNREWLKAQGLVSSPSTIRSKLGGWAEALHKAGLA